VHRHLGPGYLEDVYQEALEVELVVQGIRFSPQHEIGVSYKGHVVGKGFMDFLVAERLVIESKAVESFAEIHKAQVISYLKAANLTLGLLLNFNSPVLRHGIKRVIRSQ
jgi:GxxExxY protein